MSDPDAHERRGPPWAPGWVPAEIWLAVERARHWTRTPARGFVVGLACGLAVAVVVASTFVAADLGSSPAGAVRTAPVAAGSAPKPAADRPTATDGQAPTVAQTDATDSNNQGGSDDRDAVASDSSTSNESPGPPVLTPPVLATQLPPRQPVDCPPATVEVSDATSLTRALSQAKPGDVISLADGTYKGRFVASTSGTTEQPIWLCGGTGAILDGEGIKNGYLLHLNGVAYWRVVGLTLTNSQKGVIADATAHSVLQGLQIHQIGDEAIHLRATSTGNAVLMNTIHTTGLRRDKFGEGVYVGSAKSNWGQYSSGEPDRSDFNLVLGNTISRTGSESIDVKEGTTGGAVVDNTFDGTGMTGADSWVDVKGNDWLIEGNTGRNSPLDGYQTHEILRGWGTRNTFRNNKASSPVPGVVTRLAPELANVVE